VLVADRPGRALGRVALAYLREAAVLVGEGVPPALLDAALRRWGMAWGPCEALDKVGLDVAVATLRELESAVDPRFAPPVSLIHLAAADEVGPKTGAGFYQYGRGAPRPRSFGGRTALAESAIVERLVSRLVREAVAVLCEGIVPDSTTLDGLLIGAGWPPFRGGPLRSAAPAPPVARLVGPPRRAARRAA
jgi:3-hydroxyacyl-CoA dehydrogenase